MISLKELRKNAEAATPGPWNVRFVGGIELEEFKITNKEGHFVAENVAYPNQNDGEFIAAANPATVIQLLDALKKAENSLAFIADDHLQNFTAHGLAMLANKALQELREVIGE